MTDEQIEALIQACNGSPIDRFLFTEINIKNREPRL